MKSAEVVGRACGWVGEGEAERRRRSKLKRTQVEGCCEEGCGTKRSEMSKVEDQSWKTSALEGGKAMKGRKRR